MARRRTRSAPAPRRSSGISGFWLFVLGVLVGAGVLYFGFRDSSSSTSPVREASSAEAEDAEAPAAKAPARRERQAVASAEQPGATPVAASEEAGDVTVASAAAAPGRIALVIDDLGRDVAELDVLEALGVPLTYAVLPYEEQTREVVAELRQRRKEMLLHLPMEPRNGGDPGPGALRLGMTPEELRQNTLAALRAVPGAVGVNNHMGSGLSADAPSMNTILGVIASRGLFFLDSRTSAQSVGYRLASQLGMPAAERQVFLDPDPRPDAIREQFARMLAVSATRGAAVAIGHPLPETLEVLAAEVPKARALGYEFVPVSYLLDRPDAAEDGAESEPDE